MTEVKAEPSNREGESHSPRWQLRHHPRTRLLKTTVLLKTLVKQLEELGSREVRTQGKYVCNLTDLEYAYSNLDSLPVLFARTMVPNGINRDYSARKVTRDRKRQEGSCKITNNNTGMCAHEAGWPGAKCKR